MTGPFDPTTISTSLSLAAQVLRTRPHKGRVSQEDGAARTVYQRAKMGRKKPGIFCHECFPRDGGKMRCTIEKNGKGMEMILCVERVNACLAEIQ
jgi:hypothetical protein